MHAGYADVESGDRHIANVIEHLQRGPQWANTVVIVTVDENGGWWDPVSPPQGRPLGSGLANSCAGDFAAGKEGLRGSHGLRHQLDPALHQPGAWPCRHSKGWPHGIARLRRTALRRSAI